MGPSHEMGHYVGSLCDEDSEHVGVHPSHGQSTIWRPNASYQHSATQVPWANWLSAGLIAPTRSVDGSLGIYEGADYYSGGAYRPSYNSMMRDLAPLFNEPSLAALQTALQARTGSRRRDADATGRCLRLPINAIHRRGVEC